MAEMTRLSTRPKTIREQIAAYPMPAFLILAYAISWTGWTLSEKFDLGLANGFGVIGSAGPALAAMMVSALLRPEPSGIPAAKRWRLFGIIGILAMTVMLLRRLWTTPGWLVIADTIHTTAAYPGMWAFLVDLLAAFVVAYILSGIYSPKRGISQLLHSLDPRGRPVRGFWWILALGLYPAIFFLGNTLLAGSAPALPAPVRAWPVLLPDLLLTFLYLLIGGGGLEEPGWRAFFQPSLQKRYSPVRSTLILAVFWTLWHLPFFWWLGGGLQGGVIGILISLLVYFITDVLPTALLLTAIFNRSGGSLPIVILLHASINTISYMFQPVSLLVTILWVLLGAGIMLWMWRSPLTFPSPAQQP